MYAYIKGTLTAATPLFAIIEAAGIGFKLLIPANVIGKLPQLGSEAILHTSFLVREQSQALYGFLKPNERDMFELLLNVTGIGPKIALSLIGHMEIHTLQQAIAQGDIPQISRVPGIGKKTSERLIIEMRDKIPAIQQKEFTDFAAYSADPQSQKISDAMSALINLGYNQATAQKALKKTLEKSPDGLDLGELITESLKNV